MKKLLFISIAISILYSCSIKTEEVKPVAEKSIIKHQFNSALIYTTAKDTDLRLTKSGTFNFVKGEQPLETELSVFVNPDKTFQKFIEN